MALTNEQIATWGGFGIIFVVLTIWIIVSAWMDMRSVLANLGIPQIERHVYVYAGIKRGRQVPFDVLFYIALIAMTLSYIFFEVVRAHPGPFEQEMSMLHSELIVTSIEMGGFLCLGLVALTRRFWLSKDSVRSADTKLP